MEEYLDNQQSKSLIMQRVLHFSTGTLRTFLPAIIFAVKLTLQYFPPNLDMLKETS